MNHYQDIGTIRFCGRKNLSRMEDGLRERPYLNSTEMPRFTACWSSGYGCEPSETLFRILITSYNLRTLANCSATELVSSKKLTKSSVNSDVVRVIKSNEAKERGMEAGY